MGSNTDAHFTVPPPPRSPLIATTLLALLLAATSHAAQRPDTIAHTWQGTIEKDRGPILPPYRYDLTLTIAQATPGHLTASLYAPVWGETDWPCEGTLEDGGLVTLSFTDAQRRKGLFKLQLGDADRTLFGQYAWKISAFEEKDYRVRLTRLDAPATRPARPPADAQIPVPPFPYAQERVVFKNGDLRIAGLLTLPPGAASHPAIVLIPGSEPHTVDPEIPGSPESEPWLWVIADHLTRAGYATLRTDSRGVGGTAGDFDQATLQDLAADAQAAVTFLGSRKEIDPVRLGLVGHSQGATVAAIAAARDQHVRFLVMLGVGGQRGDRVMLDQLNARWDMIPRAHQLPESFHLMSVRIIELAVAGTPEPEIRQRITSEFARLPELAKLATPSYIAERAKFVTGLRWRSVLRHDPRDDLNHCRVPVLAMSGEKDFLVDPKQNLPAVRDAIRAGGNPDVSVITLPGLDHSFRKWHTKPELPPPGELIDPAALTQLEEWLDQHVARPKHP